jgi:hypothetical protein
LKRSAKGEISPNLEQIWSAGDNTYKKKEMNKGEYPAAVQQAADSDKEKIEGQSAGGKKNPT